jgi:hypothetical protein
MSALVNNILKTVRKSKESGTESDERGDKIRSRAGMIINVFAALLAFNTYVAGSLNSTILNNTIKANDIWSFYQAKSIKQSMAEYAREDAQRLGKTDRVTELTARIDRYESEPATNEGKQELFVQAKKLEAERDVAKKKSPWIGYASTAYQLSIVLLSTSILTVSVALFWGSFVMAGIGIVLMTQGLWLWMI